mmetsp:Transcript_31613/g.72148  ORF Transcript_31613/g.72148 Transcript_31613/m.72148 type:complete len:134 (-) Transcript_31613:269-670(-)
MFGQNTGGGLFGQNTGGGMFGQNSGGGMFGQNTGGGGLFGGVGQSTGFGGGGGGLFGSGAMGGGGGMGMAGGRGTTTKMQVSNKEIDALFRSADTNGDGTIDYEEFFTIYNAAGAAGKFSRDYLRDTFKDLIK